jgi:hypothetical protein
MKRPKRLICALCVLAMVMLTYTPAQAEYLGCLRSDTQYTLEVNTTTRVALTILLVTTRGRLEVEEILAFDPPAYAAQVRTFPRNIDRVILVADAPINGSGILKITQGTSRFELSVTPHAEAVIDLSPGPICPAQ